ncbi:hypothetical protein A2U01_0076247, partial [Trifolium medium]|nr:hypothetical protein [Trifolium medium]
GFGGGRDRDEAFSGGRGSELMSGDFEKHGGVRGGDRDMRKPSDRSGGFDSGRVAGGGADKVSDGNFTS